MKIVIETDGLSDNTHIQINGDDYKDIISFGFFIKERTDKCKLQIKRAVPGAPDAWTNLFGPEISRFDNDTANRRAAAPPATGK